MIKIIRVMVVIMALLGVGVTGAKAEGTSPEAPYSGDLWSRVHPHGRLVRYA